MQKLDRRSFIYGIVGTQEQVPVRQGKWAIRVQVIKVLPYMYNDHEEHLTSCGISVPDVLVIWFCDSVMPKSTLFDSGTCCRDFECKKSY